MRLALLKLVLVAIAIATFSSSNANAVVILDDLSTPTGPVLDGLVSTGPASAAGIDILGGVRVLSTTRTSGTGLVSADVALSIVPGFSYASGVSTAGNALLEYDGNAVAGITPTGLGGIDITSGGLNIGLLGEFRSDLGANLFLTVYDMTGGISSSLTAIPALGASTTFSPFSIPFASLAGTANLANVGAVSLGLDGSAVPETDVALRFLRFREQPPLTTIPEPTSLVIWSLLGLSAFGLRRKR